MTLPPAVDRTPTPKRTIGILLLIIVAILVTAVAWTGVSLKDLLARLRF
jgi:hypothetical protein